MSNPMSPEMQTLKARLKATWMAGDYGHFAQYLEPGALEFLARLEIAPGTRMLDVGCGAGQIALPAARAGVLVTGVDIALNSIEPARARALAEGVTAQFDEGDAEMLPYQDAAFDLMVSLIGAMFAPRPECVAAELLRVCRPVRRWVLSVPKRLRFFRQRDGATLNTVPRIFLRVIAQTMQSKSPGTANTDKAASHIGAVAFIHRFGSSLTAHVHFHVCVVDGVFEEMAADGVAAGAVNGEPAAPRVIFYPARDIDADAVAQAQATLRRRILRAFVGRGLLERFEAKEMLGYQHSGFSVDAGVCIEAHDRAGLERLLRYWARPPFALERLRKAGSALGLPLLQTLQRTRHLPLRRQARRQSRRHHPHPAGTDRPHCRPGVPATHTPAPLLWRTGAEFATQSCGGGSGNSGAKRHGSGRVAQHRLACSWRCAAGRCSAIGCPACTRASQAPSPLLASGADCAHLRGVPAAVPHLWWPDAHHCVHYAQR